MSQKIQIALIGTGFGNKVLSPVIQRNPFCELKAVANSSSNWRRVVSAADIDAVVIATPPRNQAPIALLAMQNKKHVFCEKPLALSAAQAQKLLTAARRVGVSHVVDFEFPEIAAFRKAKSLLEKGFIGKIRHVAVSWNVETLANKMRVQSWKTETREGGGALFSFVCHSFYYLEWFAGNIKKLDARLFHTRGLPGSGDTLAHLFLEFKSGAAATLSMSTDAIFGNGHRIEFYGEKGKIVLDNPTADYAKGFKLFLGTRKDSGMQEIRCGDKAMSPCTDGRIEPVSRLFNRFVFWIQTGKATRPSFKEGCRVQYLLDAAWTSHKKRTRVSV